MRRRPSAARRNLRLHYGGILIALFLATGTVGPHLLRDNPNAIDLTQNLAPPTGRHPFGTDTEGRDLLSRVVVGARTDLVMSVSAVALGGVTGIACGLVAGYYPRVRTPIMRFMDVLLAFPSLVVALGIIAVVGSSLRNVIIALAIYQVPQFTRLVNGVVLSLREQAYVESARAAGARDGRIIGRYIVPNMLPPVIVQISLFVPSAITIGASLSFLGLGISPPTAEWGSMLQNSLEWAGMAPHVMIAPGLALMAVILGFNLFGDGLRDALDPRLRI
ncbi:MAG TPA: ABC transporter permease [bacterium]|nr:ABC transporter permease [bacterium]